MMRCSPCFRHPRERRRGSPGAAAFDAQGQPIDGIFLSDFEQGEIGPGLFRHACLLGLEGLVYKHRESNYRGGRSDHWITELVAPVIENDGNF
jgi:hypothetical protein